MSKREFGEFYRNTDRLSHDRRLPIVAFALFSSWLLGFPFQGPILHSLAAANDYDLSRLSFVRTAATCLGLYLAPRFVRNMGEARRGMLRLFVVCAGCSMVFFFPPTSLWGIAQTTTAFAGGVCVAAWGYYFRIASPRGLRMEAAADMIVLSHIPMIGLSLTAVYVSGRVALALSIVMIACAYILTLRLPSTDDGKTTLEGQASSTSGRVAGTDGGTRGTEGAVPGATSHDEVKLQPTSVFTSLAFLCVFIVVVTINSGLMYQVISPSYAHLTGLVSWYWAVPYLVAMLLIRRRPKAIDSTYILYVAMAMLGLAFVGFGSLDRGPVSYLIVNTLMMGACGVYDLYWWSILGEMLDMHHNPAMILGTGLGANVLGVLLGGLIGAAVEASSVSVSAIAFAVVCTALIILPPAHKRLASVVRTGIFLANPAGAVAAESVSRTAVEQASPKSDLFKALSDRENQVASLLLQGRTYRLIAKELYISENTVKSYVKGIYSKLGVRNRTELVLAAKAQEESSAV
jgi:DNA-binding CsgD family transcriptional regulator